MNHHIYHQSTCSVIVYGVKVMVFNVAVSFIGGGNRIYTEKTTDKSLTNFIIQCCVEYTSPDRLRQVGGFLQVL